MPSFTPIYPTIQALISNHSDLAGHNGQAAVDWDNLNMWQSATNSFFPVTGNLTIFDMVAGTEDNFKSLTGANFPGGSGPTLQPVGKDNVDFIYLADSGHGVHQIESQTLTQRMYGGPSFVGGGYVLGITDKLNRNWIMCLGPGRVSSTLQTLDVLRFQDLSLMLPTMNYNNTIAVGTPGIVGDGMAYVVSSDANGSAIVTGNNARFFNINTNLMQIFQTGTIRPKDVDPAWNIIGVEGCCMDQSDGFPMFVFDTGEAVTNQRYLCKLDTFTGNIIWKLALPNSAGVNAQLVYSDIEFQILGIMVEPGGPNNECLIIRTDTGQILTTLTTGLSGFSFGNTGAWSDVFGAFVINLVSVGPYVPNANMPLPLNSTPGTWAGWALLNLGLPQQKPKIAPVGSLIPLPDPVYIEPPGKFYPWGK